MKHIPLLLMIIGLLVGCGRADSGNTPITQPYPVPSPDPTVVATPSALAEQLTEAQQRWQQQSISSYQLTILEVHGVWSAQRMVITIQNGQLVDQSAICIPAPIQNGTCKVQPFDPSRYQVEGLFAQANDLIGKQSAQYIQLAFDPATGAPTMIGFDDPQIRDEEYSIKVEQFIKRETPAGIEQIELKLGESAELNGLRISADRVSEDSRCPRSVDCAWAGQVTLELSISVRGQPAQSFSQTLIGSGSKPAEPISVDGWQIRLAEVKPYPATTDGIANESYRFVLVVSPK
ncbi:MAG: hypothetical protein Fur005_48610 [Roseiflexaceae bacterium]